MRINPDITPSLLNHSTQASQDIQDLFEAAKQSSLKDMVAIIATKKININAPYIGATLLHFLLKNEELPEQVNKVAFFLNYAMETNQLFELLVARPNPQDPHPNLWFLLYGMNKYKIISILRKYLDKFNPDQIFELLTGSKATENKKTVNFSAGWFYGRNFNTKSNILTHFIEKLNVTQRLAILNAKVIRNNNTEFYPSVLWSVAHDLDEDLSHILDMLINDLNSISADQLFELLNESDENGEFAPSRASVLDKLIYCKQTEKVILLLNKLSLEQKLQLFTKKIINQKSTNCGMSVLLSSISEEAYFLIDFLHKNLDQLSKEKIFELLSAAYTNTDNNNRGICAVWLLANNCKFEQLMPMLEKLNNTYLLQLLIAAPLSEDDDDFAKNLATLLLNKNDNKKQFFNLLRILPINDLITLLYHRDPNDNFDSSLLKTIVEKHADLFIELLNSYTSDDLIELFNKANNDSVEYNIVKYVLMTRLIKEIYHVMNDENDKREKNLIRDHLAHHINTLLALYNENTQMKPDHLRDINEKLANLFKEADANKTYNELIRNILAQSDNQHYQQILRHSSPLTALAGLGHFFAIMAIGSDNKNQVELQAITLATDYANQKFLSEKRQQQLAEAELEIKRLKEQLLKLTEIETIAAKPASPDQTNISANDVARKCEPTIASASFSKCLTEKFGIFATSADKPADDKNEIMQRFQEKTTDNLNSIELLPNEEIPTSSNPCKERHM